MNHSILRKALTNFVHPLTLFAIVTLLFNDHVLRQTHPSWWTGKIGDAAWLFFFPFVIAIPLAMVSRTDNPKTYQRIGIIAIAVTTAVFVVGKTLPIFTELIESGLRIVFSAPFRIITDPSDLLTLVALAPSWFVWQSNRTPPSTRRMGWVTLTLAVLLTIANSAMPDYGIVCLSHQDDMLFASSNYYNYASNDGGLTWQSTGDAFQSEGDCFPDQTSGIVTDTSNNRTIRYSAGKSIEVSDDGVNWETLVTFTSTNEAAQALYEKNHPLGAYSVEGPLAAILDPQSGNVIFAMGHSGVLVLQPDGESIWAAVGEYRQQTKPAGFASFTRLLSGEFFLGIAAGLLTIASLGLIISRSRWKKILIFLAWITWLVVLVVLPPAITNQAYGSGLSSIAVTITALLAVFLAIFAAIQIGRHNFHQLGIVILIGLGAALLFLIPYILWSINALHRYWAASVFGVILVAALTIPAYADMKQRFSQQD